MHGVRAGGVDALLGLLEAAAGWMVRRGIRQWRPEDTTHLRAPVTAAAADGRLFLSACGRVAVQLDTAAPTIWAGRGGSALYLKRLVVHPDAIGHGLGEAALAWACDRAVAAGNGFLRLDCVADNTTLVRWYQARGCLPRGTAQLPRPGGGEDTVLRLERRVMPLSGEGLRYRRLDDVPWAHWQPEVEATLLFLRRDDELLLIHKKRGMGAGKVNGPGGKLEPGETPLACALRETREETHVEVPDARHIGHLRFQWCDGQSLYGHVFVADRHSGVPGETDEARPFWCSLDALPWDAMWEDDRLWLPLALEERPFDARFLIQGEQVAAHWIDT